MLDYLNNFIIKKMVIKMTEFKDALKILKQNDPKLGKVIELINPEYNKKNNDDSLSL